MKSLKPSLSRFWFLALAAIPVLNFVLSLLSKTYKLKNRVVVITGGSRGLGFQIAIQCAKQGASLALLARNEQELKEAGHKLTNSGASVLTVRCDISDQMQVRTAVQIILNHFGHIDVLINNAGISQVGPFEDMNLEDFTKSLGVHTFGPLYLLQEILPHMRKQKSGRVVNISSLGGRIAVPHLLPYVTGKFALTGLSEGLQPEVAADNIRVTTVIPGL